MSVPCCLSKPISVVRRLAARILSIVVVKPAVEKRVRGLNNEISVETFSRNVVVDINGNNNTVTAKKGGHFHSVVIEINGSNNTVTVKKGAHVERLTIFISGNDISLSLGENVSFCRGDAWLWMEGDKSCILINDHCSFYGDVHIASTEGAPIKIGEGCLIASGVQIRSGDSHSIYRDGVRFNHARAVTISDRVWLAEGAVVLKGVEISPDSVVATKAVVTKAFPEKGVIIAGNPASVVKTGITWGSER